MESEDADEERNRRKHPKDVERYIAWLRAAERQGRPRIPPPVPGPSSRPTTSHHHHHHHNNNHHHQRRSWDEDADAEGEADGEADCGEGDGGDINSRPSPTRGVVAPLVRRPPVPVGLADLDSPAGRRTFISASVSYLFATTYESSDDMSISALLTYLNAAMPQDKHEDFDTTEVVKGVTALQERGRIVLEGDILRLL